MDRTRRDRIKALFDRQAGAATASGVRAADGDVAEVLIYDFIDWLGVDAASLVPAIGAITAGTIRVRLNSPGGDVFDGMAIYNALKRHRATVEVHVDGIAASIASVIAMAGDEIVMAEGSFLMIHEPWTMVVGNAADMRKEADVLDGVAAAIAGIYSRRSGNDQDDIREMMADETWLDAAAAVTLGFADSADEAKAVSARFNPAIFDRAPASLAVATRNDGGAPWATRTDFERHLRKAGCSAGQAKAIAAAGFKAHADPREEAVPADIVAAVKRRGLAWHNL